MKWLPIVLGQNLYAIFSVVVNCFSEIPLSVAFISTWCLCLISEFLAWLLVWWFGIHLLLEVKPICLWVYVDCRCLNSTHFVSVIPTFCFHLAFAELFHFVGLSTVFQFNYWLFSFAFSFGSLLIWLWKYNSVTFLRALLLIWILT